MKVHLTGSKEGQDYFASLINGGNPGYFVDLGSAHPQFANNTIRLERIGWTGIAIDRLPWCVQEFKRTRIAAALEMDLEKMTRPDLIAAFEAADVPPVIDFLSFDVDEATLHTIEIFPFEKYRFKCMTFEHDSYGKPSEKRDRMIERLRPWPRYRVIAEDVCYENRAILPIEDWWIDSDLVPARFHESIGKGQLWSEFLMRLESRS